MNEPAPGNPIDQNETFTRLPRPPAPPHLEIRLRAPGYLAEDWNFIITLDHEAYRMLATKLPRNREIDPYEHGLAIQQQDERNRVIASVSKMIAGKLGHVIEQKDTVNGYSREEWEAMHRPSPGFIRKEDSP